MEIVLDTNRLALRKIEYEDVPVLARLWSDARVTEYEGGPRVYAKVVELLQEDVRSGQPNRFDMWTLVEKSSGAVIGHCGLVEKEVESKNEIEVTYTLVPESWGKGYATEIAGALRDCAATQLGVTRLIALIHPENIASVRVAEKIGMYYEREIERPGGAVRRIYAWEHRERDGYNKIYG